MLCGYNAYGYRYDDVIKWKHLLRYCPFVPGIYRSPVNSPHKGQWRGAFTFSLICAGTNDWANNREAGDLSHHRVHYDVIVTVTSTLVKMWITVLSYAYLGGLSVMTFVVFDAVFHHEYFKSICDCRRILSLCICYLNSLDSTGSMTRQGTQKQRIVVHEGLCMHNSLRMDDSYMRRFTGFSVDHKVAWGYFLIQCWHIVKHVRMKVIFNSKVLIQENTF